MKLCINRLVVYVFTFAGWCKNIRHKLPSCHNIKEKSTYLLQIKERRFNIKLLTIMKLEENW